MPDGTNSDNSIPTDELNRAVPAEGSSLHTFMHSSRLAHFNHVGTRQADSFVSRNGPVPSFQVLPIAAPARSLRQMSAAGLPGKHDAARCTVSGFAGSQSI